MMTADQNPYLMQVYRRALRSRDPALAQVSFATAVLERYRGAPAFSIIRTDTVGRVKREGGWALDFGIAEDERSIHASLQDLFLALPEDEHDHWAQHIVALPMSRNFLQMRLASGACIDDGEVRDWD